MLTSCSWLLGGVTGRAVIVDPNPPKAPMEAAGAEGVAPKGNGACADAADALKAKGCLFSVVVGGVAGVAPNAKGAAAGLDSDAPKENALVTVALGWVALNANPGVDPVFDAS